MILFFSSCGGEKAPDAESTGESSVSPDVPEYYEYTIIRSDTCSSEVLDASKALKAAIEEAAGTIVKMGTDYEGLTKKTDKEILVGNTGRDESKPYLELGGKSFVIDYSTTRIVITGGSGESVSEAVKYFIENYIDAETGEITMSSGEKYEYIYSYPRLVVSGNDLEGYNLVLGADINSEILNGFVKKVEKTYGYRIMTGETESEKSIIVKTDASLGENKYKNYVSGGKIYLTASDENGAAAAFSKFADMIPSSAESGEKIELDIAYEGTLPPSILIDIDKLSTAVKYFIVETDKDALDYKVGDTMHFDIGLYCGDELRSCPLFKWSINCEGGEQTSGVAAGGSGKISLEATMKNPGFVNVIVHPCLADGSEISGVDYCSAGAAAGFSEINTIGVEPEDFDEFWKKQLERLDDVAPSASSIELVDTGRGDYDTYNVKINCLGDPSFTGETYSAIMVSVPKGAPLKSLKLYVKYMGAGVRSTETHLSYKNDSICISVNGHSVESYMGSEYYSNLYATTLKNYPKPTSASQDPSEIYYSYMVMRDLQAIRWAKEYFGEHGEDLWNGIDLNIEGTSEGGFQALFTAALDKDVTSCIAHVPAICDQQRITVGRKGGYGPSDPQLLYYDCCFFARRIACPTTIRVSLGDNTCPPSGITAMYHELKCEKTITYIQNMLHTTPVKENKVRAQYTLTE